jgi:hypothetical protein
LILFVSQRSKFGCTYWFFDCNIKTAIIIEQGYISFNVGNNIIDENEGGPRWTLEVHLL